MIPGFATAYKDEEGYVHLYFYQGLTDNEEPIYRDIDIASLKAKYDVISNSDNSKDFKFHDKNIIKIHCKLINNINGEEIIKILML